MKSSYVLALLVLTVSPAAADSQGECADRWQKATDAGIVYQVGMIDGHPTVVVDESAFPQIPFETKQAMVDTLNCALFSDGSKLAEVVFIGNLSHKQMARWTPFKGLVVD